MKTFYDEQGPFSTLGVAPAAGDSVYDDQALFSTLGVAPAPAAAAPTKFSKNRNVQLKLVVSEASR